MKQADVRNRTGEANAAVRGSQERAISVIIGERHEKNAHYIAERVNGTGQFRLKTVSYKYFRSEEDLIAHCMKHGIRTRLALNTSFAEKLEAEKGPETKPPVKAERKPKEEKRLIPEADRIPKVPQSFGLNEKQLLFCNEYLQCGNATKAYLISHPSAKNANSAAACASYLLKKPQVRAYLESMNGR